MLCKVIPILSIVLIIAATPLSGYNRYNDINGSLIDNDWEGFKVCLGDAIVNYSVDDSEDAIIMYRTDGLQLNMTSTDSILNLCAKEYLLGADFGFDNVYDYEDEPNIDLSCGEYQIIVGGNQSTNLLEQRSSVFCRIFGHTSKTCDTSTNFWDFGMTAVGKQKYMLFLVMIL